MDIYTRECLAIEVATRLTGEHVAQCLDRVKFERGAPQAIFCDNGSEFVSGSMDLWAYVNQVKLDFSRPGKPTDNAIIESFNGRLREECLNAHWFTSIDDACRKIEDWRQEYNASRPHRAPRSFATGILDEDDAESRRRLTIGVATKTIAPQIPWELTDRLATRINRRSLPRTCSRRHRGLAT